MIPQSLIFAAARMIICMLVFFAGSPLAHAQNSPAVVEETVVDPSELPIPYDPPVESISLFGSFVRLIVFFGLLFLFGYIIVRFRNFMPSLFKRSTSSSLRLVETLQIAPGRFVVVVEYEGDRLLLGVTRDNINLIQANACATAVKDGELIGQDE